MHYVVKFFLKSSVACAWDKFHRLIFFQCWTLSKQAAGRWRLKFAFKKYYTFSQTFAARVFGYRMLKLFYYAIINKIAEMILNFFGKR